MKCRDFADGALYHQDATNAHALRREPHIPRPAAEARVYPFELSLVLLFSHFPAAAALVYLVWLVPVMVNCNNDRRSAESLSPIPFVSFTCTVR